MQPPGLRVEDAEPQAAALCQGCSDAAPGHISHGKPGDGHGTWLGHSVTRLSAVWSMWGVQSRTANSHCKHLENLWKIPALHHSQLASLANQPLHCFVDMNLVFHVPGKNCDLGSLLMKVGLTRQDHRNNKFLLFSRNWQQIFVSGVLLTCYFFSVSQLGSLELMQSLWHKKDSRQQLCSPRAALGIWHPLALPRAPHPVPGMHFNEERSLH